MRSCASDWRPTSRSCNDGYVIADAIQLMPVQTIEPSRPDQGAQRRCSGSLMNALPRHANGCRNGAAIGPAYCDYSGSPQSLSVSSLGEKPPQLMS